MVLSLEEIKENYSNFSDAKLELIASNSASLDPEVLAILKKEMLKRNITFVNIKSHSLKKETFKKTSLVRKFYIAQPKRILYIALLSVISYIFISFFYHDLFGQTRILRRMICLFFVLFGLYAGYAVIRQLIKRTEIVETFPDYMKISLNDAGFGKISIILYSIRVLTNSLPKVHIPYHQIISIYRDKNTWKNSLIRVSFKDKNGQVIDCKTSLQFLDKSSDLEAFKHILKVKKVKEIAI